MVIGYSLRMCAHVDSANPGRSNLVFRLKPIPEAEMSNRLIVGALLARVQLSFRAIVGSRYCRRAIYFVLRAKAGHHN